MKWSSSSGASCYARTIRSRLLPPIFWAVCANKNCSIMTLSSLGWLFPFCTVRLRASMEQNSCDEDTHHEILLPEGQSDIRILVCDFGAESHVCPASDTACSCPRTRPKRGQGA